MSIGKIENKCVVVLTMNEETNKQLGDEIVKTPGFDISESKRFDLDGIDLIEEEEIHFIMIKNPQTSGKRSDKDDEERERILNNMQDYIQSNYPKTHTKSYKVLYGEEPKRVNRFAEKVEADLIAVHRDYAENFNNYAGGVSTAVLVLG